MGWLKNTMMRGLVHRSGKRLETEFGEGLATTIFAIALSHACYPEATCGDGGVHDEIVQRLSGFVPGPCDAKMAWLHVEMWLDKDTLTTEEAFRNIWGMEPAQFLEVFVREVWGMEPEEFVAHCARRS